MVAKFHRAAVIARRVLRKTFRSKPSWPEPGEVAEFPRKLAANRRGPDRRIESKDGVAVSATQEGLLPLNQSAMIIRLHIARHAYEGVATNEDERERLVADLGDARVLLDNHGTLYVGKSVAQAFYHAYMLEWACSTQVRTLSMGLPLPHANVETVKLTEATLDRYGDAFGELCETLVWPAVLRKLERVNSGYRI